MSGALVGVGTLQAGSVVDRRPRCRACNRELALALSRPWLMACPRCKALLINGEVQERNAALARRTPVQ